MEGMVLNDKNVFPDDTVLSVHLGKAKKVFDSMMKSISDAHPSYTAEWRYYNDGKSWLCKIVNKKKTICWLSVWKGYFRITFYVAARHKKEVSLLKIDPESKKKFKNHKGFGTLIPLAFEVRYLKQLADIDTAMIFKEKLK